MASRAEYVEMSKLIGRFLMPIGIADSDGWEDDDSLTVQARRGLLDQFILGLCDWYTQDNPRFNGDLFQKAIVEQAEASMIRFAEWCDQNGGIEAVDKLIEEGKELPDLPPFSER